MCIVYHHFIVYIQVQHVAAPAFSPMQRVVDQMLSLDVSEKNMADSEKASLYRLLNSNMIELLESASAAAAVDGNTNPGTDTKSIVAMVTKHFPFVIQQYMWRSRCCCTPTEIVDTFNSMHVSGILTVKALYVLSVFGTPEMCTSVKIKDFFPTETIIHVSHKCINTLIFSEFVYVVTNLQQYWHVLVKVDARKSCLLLLLCMTRFGYLSSHNLPNSVLDDIQEREDVASGNKYFVMTKLCQRHFLTTFMCMARDAAIAHNSATVQLDIMPIERINLFVLQQISMAATKLPAHIHPAIESCFTKIQNNRSAANLNPGTADVVESSRLSSDKLWDYLSQNLGDYSMGEAPRKISETLETLLHDVIVVISAEFNSPDNNVVSGSCINMLKTALEFFYVVPSAEKFREINLKQEVCPGQRLNYAFEYMHFDTGQVSQVVYLHNIEFKAPPPPTTIQDWKQEAVAGPISAFLQLVPDLQIWFSDSDDPLGILGDTEQITRPAVAKQGDDTHSLSAPVQEYNKRWAIVVNRIDAFLIDREQRLVYKSPTCVPNSENHRVFTLLVLYLRKNNLIKGICTLAINGLKLNK
jgi:hypothetical protein